MIVDALEKQPREKSHAKGPNGLTGRLTEAALGYQRMLEQNPYQPQALVGISLVALASCQHEAAVRMAEAATAAAPELVVAWVALGQSLKAAGRREEAEQAYGEAIRRDSMNALARMGLGGCSHDRDLADAAALVATLDLIITTDTCIAHLAGAMGKPVWIMLPHLSDWRWMQEIETTPWYPTAKLIRQRTPGDWAAVIDRVIRMLNSQPIVRIKPVHIEAYKHATTSHLMPA